MARREDIPFDCYPRRLNEAEMSNPHIAIAEFFDYYKLPDCRRTLRNWLHAGLSEPVVQDNICPANLFSFYEQVEKLIEAAHMLKEQEAKFQAKQ